MADDSRLVDVASAVGEGTDVDWDNAERSASDDRERSVVRELRVLESMVQVARNPVVTPVPAATAGPTAAVVETGDMWGHLRIHEVIGQGSFGSVHRAWDTRLECDVAVKLIKPSGVSPSFDLSRSIKEARLLARVRHRNVVRVFGAESHDDRFGLWMELVTGRTLEQVLDAHGPMSPGEATLVGIDLSHALAAVHKAGLLHRDIKAHNVLREGGGRIVLMDFGTGREIGGSSQLTDSLAGTPLYLAPELFLGRDPSVASDVYSLGVLLYHLVTGEYPVHGSSRRDVESAHQRGQRKPLRDARPDLSPAFIDVIERALAANPGDRYVSAGEFGDALAGVAGIAHARDVVPNPWRWKWPAVAVAGLVLTAVGVSLFNSALPTQSSSEPARSSVSAGSTSGVNTGTDGALPIAGPYKIAASFYAVRKGQNVRLAQGSRVAPGDKLFAAVEASQPLFVYVINRDEAGQSYLLFPLPGTLPENPISLSLVNQLPGSKDGRRHYWEVTSAGGWEHFFLYAAPNRLLEFEQLLAALPRAEFGRSVSYPRLPTSAIGLLRGVGGLTTADPASTSGTGAELAEVASLSDQDETASGVWARKVSFQNPR